jgi:hypothetical protein
MLDMEQSPNWDQYLSPGVNLSAATQAVKRYLVMQPKLDALATAHASLYPLLQASGQDVWNPQLLRHDGLPSSNSVRYRLSVHQAPVTIDVWAVGENLQRSPARDILPQSPHCGIRTNGSDWQIIDFTSGTFTPLEANLYDEDFPLAFHLLFAPLEHATLLQRLNEVRKLLGAKLVRRKLEALIAKLGVERVRQEADGSSESLERLMREHDLLAPQEQVDLNATSLQEVIELNLKATQLGFVRAAPPLVGIALEDVKRHSQTVKNFKGQLEVTFDGRPVEIRSRSGYYYVLAALAVQYGRADAVPVDLLVRPPHEPPACQPHRPLGKPGWYLLLPDDLTLLEQAVQAMLDNLNLAHRFKALQRGQAFPAAYVG